MDFYFVDSFRPLEIPQTIIEECKILESLRSLGEQECPPHITRQAVADFIDKYFNTKPQVKDSYEDLFKMSETMIALGYEGPLLDLYLRVLAEKIVEDRSPPTRLPGALHSFYRFLDTLKQAHLRHQRRLYAPLLRFKKERPIKVASYMGEEIVSVCFSPDGKWLVSVSVKIGAFARARVYEVSDQSLVFDGLTPLPHVYHAFIKNVCHRKLTYIAVTHWPDSPHAIHETCPATKRLMKIEHRYGVCDSRPIPVDITELEVDEGYALRGIQAKGFEDLPLRLLSIRENIELIHSEKNIMLDTMPMSANDFYMTATALSPNLELLAIADLQSPASFLSSIYLVFLEVPDVAGMGNISDFETYADYIRHLKSHPPLQSPPSRKFSQISLIRGIVYYLFMLVGTWLWAVFVFAMEILHGW
jgi:hypothetical protein